MNPILNGVYLLKPPSYMSLVRKPSETCIVTRRDGQLALKDFIKVSYVKQIPNVCEL